MGVKPSFVIRRVFNSPQEFLNIGITTAANLSSEIDEGIGDGLLRKAQVKELLLAEAFRAARLDHVGTSSLLNSFVQNVCN